MIRSKAISLSISAALLVSMAGVTAGCNTKQPANTNVRTKNVLDGNGTTGRIGVNSLRDNGMLSTRGYTTRGTGNTHNLSNAHMSQELADKIAAMKEVKSANVLVSGDSAYVAVSLRDTTNGGSMSTKSWGGSRDGSFNNAGTMRGSSFDNGTGMGMRSTTGKKGVLPNPAAEQHGIRNYSGTGESITRDNGYNATTYGTAGTTGTSKGYSDYRSDTITSDIKDKISSTVKSTDATIKNVYVSASPDFVQHLSNYAEQVKGGHPISGVVTELSDMVERIFPTNVGNGNRTTNYNAPVHHFAPTNR